MGGNHDDVNDNSSRSLGGSCGISGRVDSDDPQQPKKVTCERCGGTGKYKRVYVCYGCAGTGTASTPIKRLVCVKPFDKYGYRPGDRCSAFETTPAAYTKEERYIVRNWRTGGEYPLLKRQINEHFRETGRS